MLVLTRKSQQRIRIGNDITVTILKVRGNAVSVGIEAPRDVRVVRGELKPIDDARGADSSDGEAAASDGSRVNCEDDLQAKSTSNNSLRAFVRQLRSTEYPTERACHELQAS